MQQVARTAPPVGKDRAHRRIRSARRRGNGKLVEKNLIGSPTARSVSAGCRLRKLRRCARFGPAKRAGLGDVKPGKYTPGGKVGLDSILPAAAQAAASAARRRARRIARAPWQCPGLRLSALLQRAVCGRRALKPCSQVPYGRRPRFSGPSASSGNSPRHPSRSSVLVTTQQGAACRRSRPRD